MKIQLDNDQTKKAMTLNVVTGIVSIIVSLFSTLIITKIISTDDLGIANSFNSLKGILIIICSLSIQSAINRMLIDVEEKNEYKYLSSIYIMSSMSCILFFVLYIIFRKYLNIIFGFSTSLMILMFLILFLCNGVTILFNYWTFKNKYIESTIYNMLSVPIAQILSLFLVYYMTSQKYLGRILGLAIFDIIIGVCCGIVILKRGKFTFDKDYVKKSLKISVPMIPHLLSQILLASCDLIMIKNIVSASSSGIYSMAYTISNILYTILLKIMIAWSPWVYRKMKENKINLIYDASKYIVTGSFYLCLGLITVAPEMVNLFLPKEYNVTGNIIFPICIGIFFQIIYVLFYDIEYYHKKNVQIGIFSVVAAIINILLNFVFINKYGYVAAAYTTIVGYFLLTIMHYFGMKIVDKRKFYNIVYIVLLSIILFIIMGILIITNNNIYFRYCFFIILTIYYLIKYKKIIIQFLLKRRIVIK